MPLLFQRSTSLTQKYKRTQTGSSAGQDEVDKANRLEESIVRIADGMDRMAAEAREDRLVLHRLLEELLFQRRLWGLLMQHLHIPICAAWLYVDE